jgi:hypothetical protein
VAEKCGDGGGRDSCFAANLHRNGYRQRTFADISRQCEQPNGTSAGSQDIGGADIAAAVLTGIAPGQPPGKNQPKGDGAKKIGADYQQYFFQGLIS